MKLFALSDFHLSFGVNKPMDIFGDHWQNYEAEIKKNWNAQVGPDDIGVIAGDISWAMRMEETKLDFDFIRSLNGTKIIIRGNHDSDTRIELYKTLPNVVEVCEAKTLKVGKQHYFLCHYPLC